MRIVNIAQLKEELSAYIAFATEGEEVIIRDQDGPVARIVPYVATQAPAMDSDLVAAGMLVPARKKMDWEAFWKLPTTAMTDGSAVQTALEERQEGW